VIVRGKREEGEGGRVMEREGGTTPGEDNCAVNQSHLSKYFSSLTNAKESILPEEEKRKKKKGEKGEDDGRATHNSPATCVLLQ